MSYTFNLNVTNKFNQGEDITLSGCISGTAHYKHGDAPTHFDSTHDNRACTVDLALPPGKTVYTDTKFLIEITGGKYVLRIKDDQTFELQITNNSDSTTNVRVGDRQT